MDWKSVEVEDGFFIGKMFNEWGGVDQDRGPMERVVMINDQ